MDLTVRCLRGGPLHLVNVKDATVDDVKQLLHERFTSAAVPPPHRQRLVFKSQELPSGKLSSAGVTHGDTLVLLFAADTPPPLPQDPTPIPVSATIRSAILSEARVRGTEAQLLTQEAASSTGAAGLLSALAPRRGGGGASGDLMDLDSRLVQLIAALEGRLGVLTGLEGTAGRAPSAAAGSAAALASGAAAAASGAALAAAAAAREQAEEVLVVPEPDQGSLLQLCDMGFSDALVRKALLLCRNQANLATEWLLSHAGDDNAEVPPTQDQLRQVYGRGSRNMRAAQQHAQFGAPRTTSMPDMVAQLVDMGFPLQQATNALGRFPNVEAALAWLLQADAAQLEPAAAPPQQPPSTSASSHPAAVEQAPAAAEAGTPAVAAADAAAASTSGVLSLAPAAADGEEGGPMDAPREPGPGSAEGRRDEGAATTAAAAAAVAMDAAGDAQWPAPDAVSHSDMMQQLVDGVMGVYGDNLAAGGNDEGGAEGEVEGLRSILDRIAESFPGLLAPEDGSAGQ